MTGAAQRALVRTTLLAATLALWVGRAVDIGFADLQPFEIVVAAPLFIWLASLLRRPDTSWAAPRTAGDWWLRGLLASFLLIVLAGALSAVQALSLANVMRFLVRYLVGALVLLLLLRVLGSGGRVRLLIDGLLAGAIASSLVAAAGFFIDPLGQITIRYGDRAQALLNHPNQLGLMLAAVLPIALARVLAGPARLRRWIPVALIAGGLAMTGSKANLLLAAGMAPLMVIAVVLLRRGLLRRMGTLVGAALLTGMVAAMAFGLLQETSPRTLDTLAALASDPLATSTVANRVKLWNEALAVGVRHAPFGIGADHTGLYLPHGHAHNAFIEFFLTTGLFGLASLTTFVTCIVALALIGFRTALSSTTAPFEQRALLLATSFACLSYLASNQSSDSLGGTTLNLLWVLLALLVVQTRHLRDSTRKADASPTMVAR